MNDAAVAAVEGCRRAEKAQALFYRRLAATAEGAGDESLAARFHDLHADEPHHLSRLTARLVELGLDPAPLDDVAPPAAEIAGWEAAARAREGEEIAGYEELRRLPLDPATARLVASILEVERIHAGELGGKWTMA
jgi:rubrerythrin